MRANGQASGPIHTSRFLAFLTHRAVSDFTLSELSLAHAEELSAAVADSNARLEELESTHRSELIKLSERLMNDHNTQLARINDQAEAEKEDLRQVRSPFAGVPFEFWTHLSRTHCNAV